MYPKKKLCNFRTYNKKMCLVYQEFFNVTNYFFFVLYMHDNKTKNTMKLPIHNEYVLLRKMSYLE